MGFEKICYYPFGMGMPGRKYSATSSYRYGFNGKEQDKDINSLTAYDYGFRIYNPALGRFLSVDPLTKGYPWYTPYQFAGNMPIWAIDLDGLEEKKSTLIRVNKIMDPQGNLIKGSVTGISDGGKVATISSGETVLRQGDADGVIIYEDHIYTVHTGLRSDGLPEIAHSIVCCRGKEVPTNNLVQTNEDPIKPGTDDDKPVDVITWRSGTRTTATPIVETNTFSRDLNIAFQKENRSNPGTGFINPAAAKTSIAAYADELKANGITSINIKVTSEYYHWDTKANYFDYTNASDLVAARAAVIKGLFAANGIAINRVDENYNQSPSVSASASKATTTITGYNVTTTPIRQKLVNGKPTGTPRIDGGSSRTVSSTKPKTGDTWRR